jgi:hypothetical protein
MSSGPAFTIVNAGCKTVTIDAEAKLAALKAQQEVEAKNAKPKDELTRNKPAPTAASVLQAPSAPVQPVLRMPAPEGCQWLATCSDRRTAAKVSAAAGERPLRDVRSGSSFFTVAP